VVCGEAAMDSLRIKASVYSVIKPTCIPSQRIPDSVQLGRVAECCGRLDMRDPKLRLGLPQPISSHNDPV